MKRFAPLALALLALCSIAAPAVAADSGPPLVMVEAPAATNFAAVCDLPNTSPLIAATAPERATVYTAAIRALEREVDQRSTADQCALALRGDGDEYARRPSNGPPARRHLRT